MAALELALWCCGIYLIVVVLGIGGSLLLFEMRVRAARKRPTVQTMWFDEPLDFERLYKCLSAERAEFGPTVNALLDGKLTLEEYVRSLDDDYDRAARTQGDRLDRELDLRLRRKQMKVVRK